MRSQRTFFLSCLIGAMMLGSLPFALGRILTPAGATFYGNKYIAPGDFSVYYSYINQGAQGHVFMYDAFTSEAHTATLFQPLWFLVGLGARLFHLDAPTAFAIARLLATPILLFVLWWVAGWIWRENERLRRVGFGLSIVAGGLGAIAYVIGPHLSSAPWTYPDLWVSEAFTVLTLWSSAHFILVTSGIIFILVAVERSWIERSWRWAIWAGVVALATLMIHPFHVLTWTLVWVLLTSWRWIAARRFPGAYVRRWLLVLCFASPALLLYGLQLLVDPLTIARAAENINLSGSVWVFVVGVGLPLLGASIGIRTWRPKNEQWRWLVALAVSYCIAVYLPLTFQRRLSQGMMLPLVWLSVPAFIGLLDVFRGKVVKTFSVVVILVTLSTSWLLVGGWTIREYIDDLRVPTHMYYIGREHLEAARFLRATDPHQPLLTSLIESNVLAGLTSHQVYVGLGAETLELDRKMGEIDAFFSKMTIDEQRRLLKTEQLCYVMTSPRTRAYGGAFQPDRWSDLSRVWSNASLAIYQTPYCR